MKVKALKVFGDGKRLYSEGEVTEMTKELVETLNSTPYAPLVEAIKEEQKEGADKNGSRNRIGDSKSKTGNKHNS